MSEATTLEAPESMPSTPAPEAVAPPSLEEVQAPGTQEVETPAAEVEKPEPTPKPLEDWTLDELNAKAKTTGLDAAEVQRRDSLHQSLQDRRAYEQQQLAQLDQAQKQQAQALANTYQKHTEYLSEQFDKLLAGQDVELTKERMGNAIRDLQAQAQTVAEAPIHMSLNQLSLQPQFYGDSPQNRRALAAMTVDEKIDHLMRRAYELGQTAGAPKDHKTFSPKELEDHDKAVAKTAEDNLKAANPLLAPPKDGERRGGVSKYYSEMTSEERTALSPSQRDAAVAAESAARAGR